MRFCISLVAILAVTFIYVSCNRHSVQKPVANSNKILSGWSYTGKSDLDTRFTFNERNHVIKEETAHDISTYDLRGDSVIITEFSTDENRVVYEFKGRLDKKSRLVSGLAVSSYITTAPDTVEHMFQYNSNGFLSMEKRIAKSSDVFLVKYEYDEGVLSKVETFTNGHLFNTKKYQYYDEFLSYALPEETKFRKNVNNLVGLSGNRLVKKVISTGRNGKENYKLNFEYQVDQDGYAAKMISKKGKKANVVMTYLYDDVIAGVDQSVAAK